MHAIQSPVQHSRQYEDTHYPLFIRPLQILIIIFMLASVALYIVQYQYHLRFIINCYGSTTTILFSVDYSALYMGSGSWNLHH